MQDSIVTFHIGRSGSRVVGKLLDQHPEIDWRGEAIRRPLVEKFCESLDDPDRYDTYEHLATLSDDRTAPFLGVEVKFFHLAQRRISVAEFVQQVAAMGCSRFIVLQRKNVLRKIVSSIVAKQSRSYHRESGDPQPGPTQIEIAPSCVEIDGESKPLLSFLRDYQAGFDELDAALAPHQPLHLNYEDHISDDPRQAYREICDFAGLEPADPEVPYGKTNPFPLGEIVTNLSEVRTALEGTPFSWMAEEG